MPSQAVIEFLSSPDIVNVVNNVVAPPDFHYTASAGNSFWNGFPTFVCLALQVLLLLKQYRLSQEINLNTQFENENHFVRGELSIILLHGEALCESTLVDIQEEKCAPHAIVSQTVRRIKDISLRISSLMNIGQELDEDIKNDLKNLKKEANTLKGRCNDFLVLDTNTDISMDTYQSIGITLKTLKHLLEGLQKTLQSKTYVIKKKPQEKIPFFRFI